MGRGPKLGRGNIPMGSEYFIRITLFFVLNEPQLIRRDFNSYIVTCSYLIRR
jgi:hypothetical protein